MTQKYVFSCPNCCSHAVQALSWLDPNTDEVSDMEPPEDGYYCTSCDETLSYLNKELVEEEPPKPHPEWLVSAPRLQETYTRLRAATAEDAACAWLRSFDELNGDTPPSRGDYVPTIVHVIGEDGSGRAYRVYSEILVEYEAQYVDPAAKRVAVRKKVSE